jgi:hypothetical protein
MSRSSIRPYANLRLKDGENLLQTLVIQVQPP